VTDENPCVPGPCGPTEANAPLDMPYACTIAAGVQFAVDQAARMNAVLGLRPYRVFMVWQVRDRTSRTWREDLRVELMPVQVLGLDELGLMLGEAGQYKDGTVELLELSPRQVDERALAGYRDGQPWAADDNDREFFYEVVHRLRCPGDPEPERHRFTLAAPPFHDAEGWQYRVRLKPQLVERAGDGVDQSLLKHPPKRPKVTT
jgi:hypothetical protein